MLVICFEKHRCLGGYGDRIVGLIAVQTLTAGLGQEFRILWNKEDITPYFTYASINADQTQHSVEYNLIDNQQHIKRYLMTTPIPFDNPITKFHLNQEIAQYLFKNPIHAGRDYFATIFRAYKELYTATLKPTDHFLEKVAKCISNTSLPIIGIQIRCGDCFMVTNPQEGYNTGARDHIHTYLKQIKGKQTSPYAVFVTSDYTGILEETRRVFENVLYIDDVIQHIDRTPVDADISKVFVDHYILSQKTMELYISTNSNYGRTAALSAVHDHIYDVATAEPVEKRTLLSKHEMIWS